MHDNFEVRDFITKLNTFTERYICSSKYLLHICMISVCCHLYGYIQITNMQTHLISYLQVLRSFFNNNQQYVSSDIVLYAYIFQFVCHSSSSMLKWIKLLLLSFPTVTEWIFCTSIIFSKSHTIYTFPSLMSNDGISPDGCCLECVD